MAKAGTPKPEGQPEQDRVQAAKEKAARAAERPAGVIVVDKITQGIRKMTEGLADLEAGLKVIVAGAAYDTATKDMINKLATIQKNHAEELAQTRKDTSKWLAALEHKIAEQAQGQLEIVTATPHDDTKLWNGIETLAARVQAIEDLLTQPDQTPTQTSQENTPTPDHERIRNTAYQRIPRATAREHVLTQLQDGRWHNVQTLANKRGKQHTPPWRYWRGLYTTHLRELHQEGHIQRRDSNTRGALYEYKLK